MSIRTTNFDALAAAAPLDRQASVVRDGSGDQWAPKLHTPPPRWDAPPLPEKERPSACEDLAGRAFGRFTCIRYHTNNKYSGAQWLCRCSCGAYELRRSKIVRNPPHADYGCAECECTKHLAYMSRKPNGNAKRAEDATMLDRLAEGSR